MWDDYETLVPEFDAGNYHFSGLASQAAIALDNFRLERLEDDKPIQYLSGLLEGFVKNMLERVNPTDVAVLANAISGRKDYKEFWKDRNDINNLYLQASLVSRDLRDFRSLPEERRNGLLEFCIKLSRELSANYDTYHGRRFLAA